MVLPFGNSSGNYTSAWIPEPNRRGTFTLLSTCIVTISLCVYTAVHLNVPQHGKTRGQWLRKFKWLLFGLIAPEFVAYTAWQQRYEAQSLLEGLRTGISNGPLRPANRLEHIKKIFAAITRQPRGDPKPSSTTGNVQRYASWTLVHGFYAYMGGFAFSFDSQDESFLPVPLSRASLTPEGISFLLSHEPGILPFITQEQIEDKSKADGLKKFLVCAQATWFCVQCVTRMTQSLPLSLLELNTFAHALCTLVIYLLWWHKPLDVEEPTLITDSKYFPIFAYMWMTSKVSAADHIGYDIGGRLRDEFDSIWPFENPVTGDLIFEPRQPDLIQVHSNAQHPSQPQNSVSSSGVLLGQSSEAKHGRYEYSWRRYKSSSYWLVQALGHLKLFPNRALRRPAGLFVRNTAIDHLTAKDLKRWNLAYAAIGKYGLESDLRFRHTTPVNGLHLKPRVALRQKNTVFSISNVQLAVAITVSGALYGGLHLIAWNATFPSSNEQLLWRLSALFVTCNGLLIGVHGRALQSRAARKASEGLSAMVPRLGQMLPVHEKRGEFGTGTRRPINYPLGLVFVLSTVLVPLLWFSYVIARVYLVIESFRTVAYLPSGAFETPTWPAYFPHIT
ncbi:MAG: hypothetical protein Q9186_004972 [Xanthomendoza sp. 1 TL-2023]